MRNYPLYQMHPKPQTIKELLDHMVGRYSERILFEYPQRRETCSVSYADFGRAVEYAAAFFGSRGYEKQKIAIFGENSYQWILTHFAIVCSGNIAVPIDKELGAVEAAALIKDSDCSALIYSEIYKDVVDQIENEAICRLGMAQLDEMIAQGRAYMERVGKGSFYVPQPNDLASIVFTSGTTGQSKGVMLTHLNLSIDAHAIYCNLNLGGKTPLLLPLHHTYGLVGGIYFQMLNGNTIYICKSLKRLAEDIKYCAPQHLAAVPLIAEQLLRGVWTNARKQKKDKLLRTLVAVSHILRSVGIDLRSVLFKSVHKAFGGNLRHIVSGGAPIDDQTVKGLDDFGITIINGYGITECSPVVSVNRDKFVVLHSTGIPLICNEVRIAEDGEILVRGENVMQGYYGNEQATAEVFDGEWFKTGDLGRLDKYGALHIVGRKKNLIILSNGENIPAEELELKMMALPMVSEAIVYGRNDVITAEVYLDPEYEGAEEKIHDAVQQLNRTLPQNRNIANIILRSEPFPKTTTKKIKRGR